MTLEKEPIDRQHFIRARQYCTRARDGFRHLLSQTWPGGAARIVLPAYVGYSPLEGSGILDPLNQLEIPYSFYRVDEQLNIDLSSLESELGAWRRCSRCWRSTTSAALQGRARARPKRLCERALARCSSKTAATAWTCGGEATGDARGLRPFLDPQGASLRRWRDLATQPRRSIDPGALPPTTLARLLRCPLRLWRDAPPSTAIAARRSRQLPTG